MASGSLWGGVVNVLVPLQVPCIIRHMICATRGLGFDSQPGKTMAQTRIKSLHFDRAEYYALNTTADCGAGFRA